METPATIIIDSMAFLALTFSCKSRKPAKLKKEMLPKILEQPVLQGVYEAVGRKKPAKSERHNSANN